MISIGTRVSREEYEGLQERVRSSGKKPSQFYRDLILTRGRDDAESTLVVSEIRALRIVVCELLVKVSCGEHLGDAEIGKIIAIAERQKFKRAAEVIENFRKEFQA